MASVTGIVMRVDAGGTIKQAGAAIDTFHRDLTDFSPMWPDLEQAIEDNERRVFESEGGYAGRRWAHLTEEYAARKRRKYGDKPTLEATGRLKDALTGDGPNALRIRRRDQFAFGTEGVEYASYHQSGTSNMPARPPLDFGPDLKEDIADILDRHVGRASRRARLRYTSRRSDVRLGDLDDV